MNTVKNPIIPGFAPDPSICRVGEDYYLVNSTFGYFPGLPVYHSRDLAGWELIGNALDRPSQLPLLGCGSSHGIFAPTIRYHEGIFYIVCTNVSGGGSFVITSTQPASGYSEPYWLGEDAQGIDPSIFFEDDGTCWYLGTRGNSNPQRYYGDNEIWMRQLDLNTMKLTGPDYILWNGAMDKATWAEGPHLYKKNGYYYLMIAEGGTHLHHSVNIARSERLTEGYTGCLHNPILTHRHLGKDYPVVYVGHADMVDAPNGETYMVMLASRPQERLNCMGRETFLARVEWQDNWPVVNPLIGHLEEEVTLPWETSPVSFDFSADFSASSLSHHFLTLRDSADKISSLSERPGYLRLKANEHSLSSNMCPAYLAVRQRSHDYRVCANLELTPEVPEEYGLAMFQNEENNIRLVVAEGECKVLVTEGGVTSSFGSVPVSQTKLSLEILCTGGKASFTCSGKLVAEGIRTLFLSTECAGGFIGTTVGMYACSSKRENTAVDFAAFTVKAV